MKQQVITQGSDLREIVYAAESPLGDPAKLIRDILSDFIRTRELIWILFLRDLKAQFRQSFLGYFWLFLPPVMTTFVWLFLNSQKVISVESTTMPYPLFVMIGSVVWQTFVKLVQSPLQAFTEGRSVFMKLKVPPEAFIAAGTARAVFEFGIYFLVLLPAFFLFEVQWNASILLIPIFLLALFALGTAIGLLVVPIGSLYSDVAQSVPIIMGFLMYLSPVIFPPPESGIAALVIQYNPMTPILMGIREAFGNGTLIYLLPTLGVLGLSVLTIFGCLIGIRVVMPHLVARMGM